MKYPQLKHALFLLGCAAALVSLPFFVQADTISSQSVIPDFKLQIPIEGLTGGVNIHTYLVAVYRWLMRASVVFALVMLVIAGIVWMVSRGESGLTKKAHDIIKSTFIGLGLALGSYTILFAVNANLVNLDVGIQFEEIKDMKEDFIIEQAPVDSDNAGNDVDPSDPAFNPGGTQPPSPGGNIPPGSSPGAQPPSNDSGAAGSSLANMPLFKQRNYRVPYGRCGTISAAGCGPTSAAMVARFYGKSMDPVSMANLFAAKGFRACSAGCSCQGTAHAAFTSPAALGTIGLRGQTVGRTKEILNSYLRSNPPKPIIVAMGPSIFTRGGHYIVLTGVDSAGKITVNDPAKSCYAGIGCTNHVPQELVLPFIKAAFYVHP